MVLSQQHPSNQGLVTLDLLHEEDGGTVRDSGVKIGIRTVHPDLEACGSKLGSGESCANGPVAVQCDFLHCAGKFPDLYGDVIRIPLDLLHEEDGGTVGNSGIEIRVRAVDPNLETRGSELGSGESGPYSPVAIESDFLNGAGKLAYFNGNEVHEELLLLVVIID